MSGGDNPAKGRRPAAIFTTVVVVALVILVVGLVVFALR